MGVRRVWGKQPLTAANRCDVRRWKGNLCGKVLIARAEYDDASVSPVVRQTLLHWGYELTEADFQKAEKKIRGGKGAYNVNRGQLQAAAAKKKK